MKIRPETALQEHRNLEIDFELNETMPSTEMEKSTLVSPTTISGNFSTTLTPTNGTCKLNVALLLY